MSKVVLTTTVTLTADDQETLFEMFSELVDAGINISNSYKGTVDVEGLDPANLSYSDE